MNYDFSASNTIFKGFHWSITPLADFPFDAIMAICRVSKLSERIKLMDQLDHRVSYHFRNPPHTMHCLHKYCIIAGKLCVGVKNKFTVSAGVSNPANFTSYLYLCKYIFKCLWRFMCQRESFIASHIDYMMTQNYTVQPNKHTHTLSPSARFRV